MGSAEPFEIKNRKKFVPSFFLSFLLSFLLLFEKGKKKEERTKNNNSSLVGSIEESISPAFDRINLRRRGSFPRMELLGIDPILYPSIFREFYYLPRINQQLVAQSCVAPVSLRCLIPIRYDAKRKEEGGTREGKYESDEISIPII